ncbi:CRISPR-associated protein, Csa2 [Acidianus hospitalis W1]|uniref:CRISPR-associated protein, Csa2 n=1 Tax=Acidianus hospitalis (strain W1) TaxID=933801 RepID=F4B6S9_ACIHW|nr:type I-A CRISPR-associated protein Cas7/Csa2 [Acidianus hospitalis]AEE94622.1 CRISPR-associated protein, Csa2 [Acidianus hospitalis W1]
MISGSARFLINVESLNGVESVGNLTKHRTAPVVVKTSTGYLIRYVPVISGESLAHAYQASLVDIAKSMNLPVGLYSSQYEFIKYSSDEVLKEEGISAPSSSNDVRRFEVEVLLKDIVSDVGGFMYAGKYPVRRTSRIKFGYMIPALTGEELPAQLEAQFHVRYSSKVEERQAIFNVEVSSALYTLTFSLDDDLIAVPSTIGNEVEGEEELEGQKTDRVKAAIKSLYSILTGNFGGKRSRFLPSMKLMSMVVTVTDFPFIPEPGHTDDYIKVSVERLNKAKSIFNSKNVEVFTINNENIEVPSNVKTLSSAEDLIDELIKSKK